MTIRLLATTLAVAICSYCNLTSAQLTQGFGNVIELSPPDDQGEVMAGGWVGVLRSEPLGFSGIIPGMPPDGMGGGFPYAAHEGPDDSFVAMTFTSTNPNNADGVISTWLLTPPVEIANGETLSFYTRTSESSRFPDRLEVRMSTSGESTNVGGNAFTVGDFTTSLLTINPLLDNGGYPEEWTQFEIEISGVPQPIEGRFAFHYFYDDTSSSANNVAIDTFHYTGSSEKCVLGDVNVDGEVTLADIGPFVTVLSGGGFQCEADINGDESVDLADIPAFVELLAGGP